MTTSTTRSGTFWPAISKIVAALAVASVIGGIGGIATTPAYGQHRDKGWHKGESHGDRDRREYRPVYRGSYYSEPVYVPAPVYYPPQQSPGISFFFPLDLR